MPILFIAFEGIFTGGYWCLLLVIILMAIGAYSIHSFWGNFYWCILVLIIGYYINGYWWVLMDMLLVDIGVLLVIILMAIGGYSIDGY